MKIAVRAHEIDCLLDRAPASVRTLSLDCFDTLLWRNGQAPSDVFADLEIEGGSVEPRVFAEKAARGAQQFLTGRGEVPIAAIYQRLMPGADKTAIAEAVERELEAEARHCFGFAPVMKLIADAKARGWRVIVVSDTYFDAAQLRALIARTAGDAVADSIDQIFTSSDHGLGKTEGLFGPVLDALGIAPAAMLHVGDNPHADQKAPDAFGIHSAHFVQFDEESAQRLRLEAAAATVIDAETRQSVPAYQPHRPLVSLRHTDDAAWRMGYEVVGPMMHAFAVWVRAEAEALSARHGKPVKPLFVLRDGHLPMKMFEALGSDFLPETVSISRIAAGRAAFVDADAVREWMVREAPKHRFDVLAGLLLLEKNEAMRLAPSGQPLDLAHAALGDETIAKIVRRSARYAERLVAHVKRAGVAPGDVVMLVDLGYNGTVQNLVEPMLRQRLNVEVAGRYLLLRENGFAGLDKKGFFDRRHYDRDALKALGSSIAVIEQICTVAQGSTVDYQPNGKPILERAKEKGTQSATRDRIQEAAVAFARDAEAELSRAASDTPDARRRMAAAILARLMYFPSASEVDVLGSFDHDVNLGSSSYLKLLDAEGSAQSLRRRGLPYAQRAQRIFLPGELRSQGLPLNLSLFGIVRFGLDIREGDFQVGAIRVPVILLSATEQAVIEVDAYPTHDGYYTMTVPARADLTMAIQLGMVAEMVQIDEVGFQDARPIENEMAAAPPVTPAPNIQDGMESVAAGLYRASEVGMLVVPPPPAGMTGPIKLCIAFRPVVRREPQALQKAA